MNWRKRVASVLLAMAMLNPLCCCLGKVVGGLFTGSDQSGCCAKGELPEGPEGGDAPVGDCICNEQSSIVMETWESGISTQPRAEALSGDWDYVVSCFFRKFSVFPSSLERSTDRIPGWKMHCVRLL